MREGQTGAAGRRAPFLLFTEGFRPFFLAAGLWATVAIVLWMALLLRGAALPSRFSPLAWHIHEMLFGFVLAAMAGFLLTAIPNWTGRLPVRGAPLALLAGLWLLGRISTLVSALLPLPLAIAADLAFPLALAAVAAREVIAGRNWRNLPVVAIVSLFGAADLLMHLEAAGVGLPPGIGWRLGIGLALALIALVGGRIVPSFTRNWLARRGGARLPAPQDRFDRAALVLLDLGLLAWVAAPRGRIGGIVLLLAGAAHGWRLARWRGFATMAEPLVLVLHLGYGWLALGVALLGATMLDPALPASAAVHALTVGAISTMIVAVTTRATRGHSGRSLVADRATVVIYGLLTLAAVFRVAAALAGGEVLLLAAAGAWVGGFGLFCVHYGRMLTGPRLRRGDGSAV